MDRTFYAGVNYLASDSAISMWERFDIETVRKDFDRMAEIGTNIIRVFPIWSEFQPIMLMRTYQNQARNVCYTDGRSLPQTPEGQAGIASDEMDKLAALLDEAAKRGFKVVLALLNGWVSGRVFVPPALEGRDLITDGFAVKWALKYVRYLVNRFKEHPAIYAWNLGNECNCLQGGSTQEQNYVWISTIASAIRCADPGHLISSGMMCDLPGLGNWQMAEQGELVDLTTVHPYPYFTPYMLTDPSISMRCLCQSAMMAAAHADLSGKPCMVEEINTLGPMHGNAEDAVKFLRINLLEAAAMGHRGFMWWCAFDPGHMDTKPYDWSTLENELGLMHTDRSDKPQTLEFARLAKLIHEEGLDTLPCPEKRAVCLLTNGQDSLSTACSAWILARQAGFLLTFAEAGGPLPDAELYMLPDFTGNECLNKEEFAVLKAKVAAGATLYISLGQKAFIQEFDALCGAEVCSVQSRHVDYSVMLGGQELPLTADYVYRLKTLDAEVLAEADGWPVFLKNRYGEGEVYTLLTDMERILCATPDALSAEDAPCWHEIYKTFGHRVLTHNLVTKSNRYIGVTEQVEGDVLTVTVLNYADVPVVEQLTLRDGFVLDRVILGEAAKTANGATVTLPAAGAAVLRFVKRRCGL